MVEYNLQQNKRINEESMIKRKKNKMKMIETLKEN